MHAATVKGRGAHTACEDDLSSALIKRNTMGEHKYTSLFVAVLTEHRVYTTKLGRNFGKKEFFCEPKFPAQVESANWSLATLKTLMSRSLGSQLSAGTSHQLETARVVTAAKITTACHFNRRKIYQIRTFAGEATAL